MMDKKHVKFMRDLYTDKESKRVARERFQEYAGKNKIKLDLEWIK